MTGDVKATTTVVVLDVSETEIHTRVSTREQQARNRSCSIAPGTALTTAFGNTGRLTARVFKCRSRSQGVAFREQGQHFQNGTALARTGQSKVVAKEAITTSAGTFDALKIETTIRQVNANDQTKAATLTAALWYAPTVNRWVRRTYKLQIEGRSASRRRRS